MKKLLLFVTILMLSLSATSCTNDEGDQDVEILTPDEETKEEN